MYIYGETKRKSIAFIKFDTETNLFAWMSGAKAWFVLNYLMCRIKRIGLGMKIGIKIKERGFKRQPKFSY